MNCGAAKFCAIINNWRNGWNVISVGPLTNEFQIEMLPVLLPPLPSTPYKNIASNCWHRTHRPHKIVNSIVWEAQAKMRYCRVSILHFFYSNNSENNRDSHTTLRDTLFSQLELIFYANKNLNCGRTFRLSQIAWICIANMEGAKIKIGFVVIAK